MGCLLHNPSHGGQAWPGMCPSGAPDAAQLATRAKSIACELPAGTEARRAGAERSRVLGNACATSLIARPRAGPWPNPARGGETEAGSETCPGFAGHPPSPRPEPPRPGTEDPATPPGRAVPLRGPRAHPQALPGGTRTGRVPVCPQRGRGAAQGVSFPRAAGAPAARTPAGLPSPRAAPPQRGLRAPPAPGSVTAWPRRGLEPGGQVGTRACERPAGRGLARDLGSGPAPPPAAGAMARGPRPPLRPGRAEPFRPPRPRPSPRPPVAPLTWL